MTFTSTEDIIINQSYSSSVSRSFAQVNGMNLAVLLSTTALLVVHNSAGAGTIKDA